MLAVACQEGGIACVDGRQVVELLLRSDGARDGFEFRVDHLQRREVDASCGAEGEDAGAVDGVLFPSSGVEVWVLQVCRRGSSLVVIW